MSYSFTIRAATKAEAKEKVAAEFEKVVAAQLCHARDREPALTAANSFIDMIVADDSKDVSVNMSGYLSGQWVGSDVVSISGANVVVNVGLIAKQA